MRYILKILSALFCVGTASFAEDAETDFRVNMTYGQLLHLYGERTFDGLKIGEQVEVYGVELCWRDADGHLGLLSFARITEQPGGVIVKRETDGSVSLTNFPVALPGLESSDTNRLLQAFAPYPCAVFSATSLGAPPILSISSINGETNLTVLLELEDE